MFAKKEKKKKKQWLVGNKRFVLSKRMLLLRLRPTRKVNNDDCFLCNFSLKRSESERVIVYCVNQFARDWSCDGDGAGERECV